MSTRTDITIGQASADSVIEWLITQGVKGATIRTGLGLWQEELETNVTITIIGPLPENHSPAVLALVACGEFNQDCVLVEQWQDSNYTAHLLYHTGGSETL